MAVIVTELVGVTVSVAVGESVGVTDGVIEDVGDEEVVHVAVAVAVAVTVTEGVRVTVDVAVEVMVLVADRDHVLVCEGVSDDEAEMVTELVGVVEGVTHGNTTVMGIAESRAPP